MAIGIIAQGEGTSINGVNYRVRIYSDSTAASLYTDAVEADGGTVESLGCAEAVFNELKAVNIVGYNETVAYRDAVVDDGGTLESFSCTRSVFAGLIGSGGSVISDVIPLKLAPPIFNLTYEPETDDIAAHLIPSNVELFFYNDSDEIDTLLNDLLQKQERGFFLTIDQQRGVGSYERYWTGVILQDQIEIIEASKPNLVAIRAVDGLNKLKDIVYDFENTIQLPMGAGRNPSGRTPLHIILYNCLVQALPLDLWPTTTEPFLSNTVNWWTNVTAFSALNDPLAGYLFDVRNFQSIEQVTIDAENDDVVDVIEYLSCFEVLNELAKTFICRVYMARGYWFFEQVSEKTGSLTKRNVYNKNATGISNTNVPSNEPLNGSRLAVRMRDNLDAYFPALKKVSVNQTYLADIELSQFFFRPQRSGSINPNPQSIAYNFAFFRTTRAAGTTSVSHVLGLYDNVIRLGTSGPTVPQIFTLEINGQYLVEEELSAGSAPTSVFSGTTYYNFGLRAIIDLEISSDSVASSDTFYLQDDFTWSTSVNSIQVEIERVVVIAGSATNPTLKLNAVSIIKNVTFNAPPEVGVLSVTASNWNFQRLTSINPEGWTNINVANLDVFAGAGLFFTLKTRSTGDNFVRFFSVVNGDQNISDNQTLDYGDIIFQDGAVQTGAIWANATNTIGADQRISDWRYGDESSGLPLGALIARERLALQKKPLNIYDGNVQMPLGYDVTISFDNKRLVPLNLTFSAFDDISSGRYFVITRFESLGEQVEQNLDLPTLTSPFDDFGGSVSLFGKTISQNQLGPFILAQDQAAAQIPMRTTAGRRDTIKTITAEAGQSAALTELDEVVYIVWSGANGTFALRLPALNGAISGIRLVIKLDDDFTGSQEVQLTPEAGQTINGEVNLNINGSGSFPKTYTLWGVGANWVL